MSSLLEVLRSKGIQCELSPCTDEIIIFGGWKMTVDSRGGIPSAMCLKTQTVELLDELQAKVVKVLDAIEEQTREANRKA